MNMSRKTLGYCLIDTKEVREAFAVDVAVKEAQHAPTFREYLVTLETMLKYTTAGAR